jgi:hypothetical protein
MADEAAPIVASGLLTPWKASGLGLQQAGRLRMAKDQEWLNVFVIQQRRARPESGSDDEEDF